MRTIFYSILISFILTFLTIAIEAKEPIIIDHRLATISAIPLQYINKAKSEFRIVYGHTSHGSQLTTGMSYLAGQQGSIYKFNSGQGSLSYNESLLSGDLGNPDRTTWATKTRELLSKQNNDRNLVIWSWCGQVSSASESDINTYLSLMNQLEIDFPDVIFVYMTGHLDGTGEQGNLNIRNNQIRKFCTDNNKILFDFADIESYDPDGNYYLSKKANDNCDYYEGSTKKNWAVDWCNANPGKCGSCSCAHSQCLNCMIKGVAFWNMLARIAGWDYSVIPSVNNEHSANKFVYPNPTTDDVRIITNFEVNQTSQIELFDIIGNRISLTESDLFIDDEIHFSTRNLEKGVYFVKISNGYQFEKFFFIRN